jgi:haloacetate dehalogenase
MALDHPDRVARLAVLEIAPTAIYWRNFTAKAALKVWHWPFLAQPAPLPETMIGADPTFVLEHFLRDWSRDRDLSAFDGALEGYRAAFAPPERIAAFCADYRAGARTDRDHDEADLAAGRTIAAPVLLVGSSRGLAAAASGGDAAAAWAAFAPDFRAAQVNSGHFPAEETPDETVAALSAFLSGAL